MKNFKIYTDGSHLDKLNNGRLGCGGVMISENGKILGEFSRELKPEWLKKNLGSDRVSNPTAELLGVYAALEEFDFPSDTGKIEILADYVGVQSFLSGQWRPKEPHIKKAIDLVNEIIKKKGLSQKIKYGWVKGHQKKSIQTEDAKWNNYVDSLARGEKN